MLIFQLEKARGSNSKKRFFINTVHIFLLTIKVKFFNPFIVSLAFLIFGEYFPKLLQFYIFIKKLIPFIISIILRLNHFIISTH